MRIWIILFLCLGIIINGFGQRKSAAEEACNDCKITVLVFIGLDCPVSQKYIGRLNQIHVRYNHIVEIMGLVPQEISNKELKQFRKEYNVSFKLDKDQSLSIAKRVNAKITPEVFVYPRGSYLKNEPYAYRGAIDNWFYELGRYRQQTTEHYLIDAIEAMQKNEVPKIKYTDAIGCFIQVSKHEHGDHHH